MITDIGQYILREDLAMLKPGAGGDKSHFFVTAFNCKAVQWRSVRRHWPQLTVSRSMRTFCDCSESADIQCPVSAQARCLKPGQPGQSRSHAATGSRSRSRGSHSLTLTEAKRPRAPSLRVDTRRRQYDTREEGSGELGILTSTDIRNIGPR